MLVEELVMMMDGRICIPRLAADGAFHHTSWTGRNVSLHQILALGLGYIIIAATLRKGLA